MKGSTSEKKIILNINIISTLIFWIMGTLIFWIMGTLIFVIMGTLIFWQLKCFGWDT